MTTDERRRMAERALEIMVENHNKVAKFANDMCDERISKITITEEAIDELLRRCYEYADNYDGDAYVIEEGAEESLEMYIKTYMGRMIGINSDASDEYILRTLVEVCSFSDEELIEGGIEAHMACCDCPDYYRYLLVYIPDEDEEDIA